MTTHAWDPAFVVGEVAGAFLAPFFGIGSLARHARFFHPEGVCYRAEVAAAPGADPARAGLAERLGPAALARLSAAWWRGGKEWPDALGVALRFQAVPGAPPGPTDQDLLLATIPVPPLTPFAPLWTDVHDFLGNVYYGTAPFRVAGIGPARLRLRPRRPSQPGADRVARLEAAVRAGEAELDLELARSLLVPYEPVATLRLIEPLQIDQEALRFSPFRDGRGITPRGFIQGLRRAVYAASQLARPAAAQPGPPTGG
jgi:hypothetical protein